MFNLFKYLDIMKNHKNLYKSLGAIAVLVLIAAGGYAQRLTIAGQIFDGQTPLPGVSIIEKGTSMGTVSDAEGKFSMEVNSPASVLVLTFIGYQTVELVVGNRSEFTITMTPDVVSLGEVVITALGVERETKSLGYSVQKVAGKDMVKAREPNVINSLTGRVAGLQINNQTNMFQDPVILLRGAKPLIVIDGVPSTDADLWKINADDVENYSVLKGATASALYGSIGRNGAIMITTKRGSVGKTSVEVNSSTIFQPGFIRIPEVQSTYGNGLNGNYAYVDGSGSGLEGGGWIWGPKLNQKDPDSPSGYWETPQFDSPVDPVSGERIPTPFISRGKDNVKNFFRTGLISTNNVSVSGGNEEGNFRVSTSHVYQKGIVPNTDLNNTSVGISGGYKFAKRLKTDASLTYNRQYTDNYPEVGYGPENYLYNLVLWTGTDVDVTKLRQYWEKGKEGIQQRHYNSSWYNNPYFQAYEFLQGYYKDNVFGQLKVDYNIAKQLDLVVRSGINQYSLNRSWKTPKSYIRYDVFSPGNYELYNASELNLNTDILLMYSREVSSNVSVKLSAGGANRMRNYRQQGQYTDGLSVPGFFNMNNSTNPVKGYNNIQEEKVNSVYGTLDVDLLNGIFVGLTARNDWVSTMPLKNNSFFYPSASLSAIVSEFVDLSSAHIAFLKARMSWSRVSDGRFRYSSGDTYPYNHIQAYNFGANWNNTPSLSYPGTLLNPDITPQTSDTYELGLDVRFLQGRIGLDAAVYQVRDYNNITQIPVSSSSGFTSRVQNGNEYIRKGVELTLTATPLKARNFTWEIAINWSAYRRYLESIYGGADKLGNIKAGTRSDQIFIRPYLHTPGGYLVLRSNGFPESDPFARHIGFSNPDWIHGIQNTFRYKDFSVTVSADGRVGGLIYSTTNQKMWWGGSHPGTVNQYREDANNGLSTYVAEGVVVVEGSVQYDADGNIIEDTRVYAPNTTPVNYIDWNRNTSNAYLNHFYKGTFLKLREVTLTYSVPEKWLSRTFMNAASLSLVGRNLFLWSELPNVDPDPGFDALQTPSTRNIGFNLNFNF